MTDTRIQQENDLRNFLQDLKMKARPSLHVNGPQHSTALITVDFGEPLDGFHLASDQLQELKSRMRTLADSVATRRGTININTDNARGVLWASLG